MRDNNTNFLIKLIAKLWLLAFIIIPYIIIISLSISSQTSQLFPVDFVFDYAKETGLTIKPNFNYYLALLDDSFYLKTYLKSLYFALTNTICCFIIAYPLALVGYFASNRLKIIIFTILLISFSTSMLLKIYSWTILLSNNSILVIFLKKLFGTDNIYLLNSDFAVILVMVYCYLPFMLFPIYLNLMRINKHVIEAANDLGASHFNCLRKILLPLTKPGIISGCTFVSLASMGEFVIPDLIGGSKIVTIGKLIWNQFFFAHHWPIAACSAVVLVVILTIFNYLINKFFMVSNDQI
ncbi:ABC transporter permease [Rickettsiales endosymbiont of Stachyamoeba lipophora]|uniref:ABC transporter permease n=1 Tax=Rickettsiales endosymbiont of Stachyamoeba lipophora TaxID=2486578 RepID=UPI000F64A388|nr:ABC transporter permease [Rickettsiales endosymbiont of Stachyamoeba lipophora]AZL15839.1 ABC transporter permease [Rickettsiales endosymbiont of Stachyamoeba lipophora]